VDDPVAVSTKENTATAQYFAGKQRFANFNCVSKKQPEGRVYFVRELKNPSKWE
jgi:hypothetical protein